MKNTMKHLENLGLTETEILDSLYHIYLEKWQKNLEYSEQFPNSSILKERVKKYATIFENVRNSLIALENSEK